MAEGLHFPLFQLLDSYVIIIVIIIIIIIIIICRVFNSKRFQIRACVISARKPKHKLTFEGSADGNILPLHFVLENKGESNSKN